MRDRRFKILTRKEIDDRMWNRLVDRRGATICHYSWFLDAMRTDWFAAVEIDDDGKYISVFPIQMRARYGFRFICQNPFVRYTDIVAPPSSKRAEFSLFIHYFLKGVAYIQKLTVPASNLTICPENRVRVLPNYRLSLNPKVDEMQFSMNRRRDLRKAYQKKLSFCEDFDIERYIDFHDRNVRWKIPGFKKYQYHELRKIFRACRTHGKGHIAWVFKDVKPISAAILLFDKVGIQYFSAATSQEGKCDGASTFLICELVRKYQKDHAVLDFNGGFSVESLNRFYASFGATPDHLAEIRRIAFPPFITFLFKIRARFILVLQRAISLV
jgi:hypothetical protein